MKAYLVTINDMHNYGNRLQNYATQQFLMSNSIEVENIVDNTYYPLSVQGVIRRTKRWLGIIIKNKMKCRNEMVRWVRDGNFERFNKLIRYSQINAKSREELEKYNIENDIIIVGSDQVWNPQFGISDITLLRNVSCKRKISFSSSFGVDFIPYDEKISKSLMDFLYISVREDSGAEIVKRLTGREAETLVDPTMLLSSEKWRSISEKPKGAKEGGYILTYFLSSKCKEAQEKMDELKKEREIYDILNAEDTVAGTAGPAEFLWLFDHADLILTDSFHACVFSFLFDKPFLVYDRNWKDCNMNSRIETLLRKFSLERKYVNSGLENDIWEHNYLDGYAKLEDERKKCVEYITRAMN